MVLDVSALHPTAARGFDAAADLYERARPGYPSDAVDFIIDAMALSPTASVVDLAAGTGKFTRELLARGVACVAVEPVEGMREQFARALPDVRVIDGTAESLPFGDASIDAITVAQAFHWFATDAALAEMARALRVGGTLALVWNARDDSVEWVARMSEIFNRYEGAGGVRIPRHREFGWRAPLERSSSFAPLGAREFPYRHTLTREGLLERFASVSFIAVLPDDERARAHDDMRALLRTHPDLRDAETIDHPYVTEVYLFRRT